MAKFEKGQSGNPNGRPPKSRALTGILERAGAKALNANGLKVARKRLLAEHLWTGLTEGTVTFPDGTRLELSASDWRAMVEFLYKHIDGPPVQNIDLTSNGKSISVRFVEDDDPGNPHP
jgi:hypothetical protein